VATTTPERVHLNAYVDADVRDELERLARANERSLSAEVRLGLRAYVERAALVPPLQARRPSERGAAA
jgi:hypothetical protein